MHAIFYKKKKKNISQNIRQGCTLYTFNSTNDTFRHSLDFFLFSLYHQGPWVARGIAPAICSASVHDICLDSFRIFKKILHLLAWDHSEQFMFSSKKKKEKQLRLAWKGWKGANLTAHNTTHSYTMELVMDSEQNGKNCKQVEREESV